MSIKLYDAEIEYLQSTGTQYILTNIPNRSAFSMSIKFMLTSDASYEGIFGSVGALPRPGFRLFRDGATKLIVQTGKSIYVKNTTASIKNVVITFTATANNGTLSISSNYGTSTTSSCDFSENNKWALFTSLVGGSASGKITGRIYSFTYSSSEQNVDLIPVRVGNVGYMYDKVSGKLFGNSGTGSFVLGSDVAPGRYANEVAFLESWGNQYIDTGIKPSTDTKIELKCLYCKSGAGLTNYGTLIGADDRENAYVLTHSAVANFTYGLEFSNNFANPQTRLLTFNSTAAPHKLRVYDEGGSLVTTLTCMKGVFEVNQNLYLFALNRSGTPVYGSNRIMYCKIYDGNTLVRDYVPVEYNGTGYMYDKVSGLFFDNQGTGKFLFGSIAKACARSYTRRQLMMEKNKRFSLLYHWEASDGIVNNQWIDRRKGYAFTKYGSPVVMNVSGYEVMRTNFDNYFKANLNSPALNMGSEWMIAIEFIIAVFSTDKATYLLDFGSLGPATHAFGFSLGTNKRLSMNVKLNGNTNTFRPPTTPIEFVEYKMSTIIFGAEPYDSTHNNIYTIVEGIKTSASSYPTIANCRFNRNFSSSNGFFGRGWDNNASYQSKSYKYIKSIKIYKDNKKR